MVWVSDGRDPSFRGQESGRPGEDSRASACAGLCRGLLPWQVLRAPSPQQLPGPRPTLEWMEPMLWK